jgi:hypothetical protein
MKYNSASDSAHASEVGLEYSTNRFVRQDGELPNAR